LVFVVKDCDPGKDDLLGKVTLTEEQVKAGFVGELQLTDCGEGIEAFLKVRVGEPSMLDEAQNTVQEAIAEVQEKFEDIKEAAEKKLDDAKEVIEDKAEQVAEAVGVQIDDETKAVSCSCMSQPPKST